MTINEAFQLALQHHQKGDLEQAEHIYREILEVQPSNIHCYNNLGIILENKGQLDEAIIYYQKALQIVPDFVRSYYNLGLVLTKKKQFHEAMQCYIKVLQLDRNLIEAYVNLGNILKDQGKISEAEKYYKHAIKLEPDLRTPYEALLVAMNYNPAHTPENIFSEHLSYVKHFAESLYSYIKPHANERKPYRRLKVGYVSPDFKRHPVAYFIESTLIEHNREEFEVFCYSDVSIQDGVTKRIYQYADQWEDISGMTDENVAQLIRNNSIDILVDLAGYTANNRMLMFALKPSPVQASWIGYLTTTGLSTIDYRITDKYMDPPGVTEQFYTEKLIRLPESFLCYLPDRDSPNICKLPAQTLGKITFGSFNNLAKVTPEVISTWTKILNLMPDSQLIMKTFSLSDKTTRQYVLDMFMEKGINRNRITLLSADLPPRHLESYNLVDIGLDTFPFNGAATTCEAMWMGVPVITLTGTAYHSRVGISLLSNVGLPELVAKTSEEYISIAVNLAKDLKKLESLREDIRKMMMDSPLCDAKKFTRNLEQCYRTMWETWCNSG